jgi:hypothetical protein
LGAEETETITQRTAAMRTYWRELWYAITDGDAQAYRTIKAVDVREFFTILDEWKKRIDARLEAIKQNKNIG